VAQSRGPEFGDISRAQFLENEDMALRQAAEDLKFYGLTPNRATVKLHQQFSSTSCPHLSQAIHGYGSKVQDYFIKKIKYYLSLGSTVKEMIDAENSGKKAPVARPSTPIAKPSKPSTASIATLADEVLAGIHGNGDARKKSLGNKYNAVQAEINRRAGLSNTGQRKTVKQLADEVELGLHGNGDARKRSLGSQYNAVQAEINRRAGVGSKATTKSRAVRVGDTVTAKALYGTSASTKNVRTSNIRGYVETINPNWRNEIRLYNKKGGYPIGFTRRQDLV